MKNLLSWILYYYLKFVYLTTRWKYIFPSGYSLKSFDNETKTIFALWHNRLAIAPYLFKNHKDIYALVSPHSDGKIISNIIKFLGHKIIEGSTNRRPLEATRSILNILSKDSNIAITPDGPRGPKYEINSNIIRIAKIARAKIIPISVNITNNFRLKSWDSFIFPLPFGKGVITVGDPMILSENDDLSMLHLKEELMRLSFVGISK